MPDQVSAVFEQVMATCARGCFTGLLRVRTREGSGELRFLSGIQDGVRFGSMEGDAALERLQTASDPEFEVISSLPPIDPASTEPVPTDGRLEELHAAQLMRYCEANSLTCSLELEVDGRVLTARYRLGELLSVEPDSEHTARVAEAKQGRYSFKLPRFELPEHVVQRSAGASAAPAPESRPRAAAQSARGRALSPAPTAAKPAPAANVAPARPAATPAAAPKREPATAPAPVLRPPAAAHAARPGVAAAAASPISPQGVISAGAPLKASPAIAVAATPVSSREAPPAVASPPSSRGDAGAAAQQAPQARPLAVAAPAPAPSAGAAQPSAAATRAGLQDLWKDAVEPPSQAAPLELPTRSRAANDAAPAARGSGRDAPHPQGSRRGQQARSEREAAPAAASGSRAWLWVVLALTAASSAAWFALGSPMP